MTDPSYTHVLLDDDSGEPVGVIRDVDELPNGTPFGVVRRFGAREPDTYIWLDGLTVIRIADAAPHVRNHVAWELANAQPV